MIFYALHTWDVRKWYLQVLIKISFFWQVDKCAHISHVIKPTFFFDSNVIKVTGKLIRIFFDELTYVFHSFCIFLLILRIPQKIAVIHDLFNISQFFWLIMIFLNFSKFLNFFQIFFVLFSAFMDLVAAFAWTKTLVLVNLSVLRYHKQNCECSLLFFPKNKTQKTP